MRKRHRSDGLDRHSHTRRIGQAQVALRRHRLGGDDLDFARAACAVVEQRLALGETDIAFVRHQLFSSVAHALTKMAAIR
jgi:hypothetical protein